MPWKREQRHGTCGVRLIQDYEEGHSISALAEIYDVSRKTIYKWLERYDEAGALLGSPIAAALHCIFPANSATASSLTSWRRAIAGTGDRASYA